MPITGRVILPLPIVRSHAGREQYSAQFVIGGICYITDFCDIEVNQYVHWLWALNQSDRSANFQSHKPVMRLYCRYLNCERCWYDVLLTIQQTKQRTRSILNI